MPAQKPIPEPHPKSHPPPNPDRGHHQYFSNHLVSPATMPAFDIGGGELMVVRNVVLFLDEAVETLARDRFRSLVFGDPNSLGVFEIGRVLFELRASGLVSGFVAVVGESDAVVVLAAGTVKPIVRLATDEQIIDGSTSMTWTERRFVGTEWEVSCGSEALLPWTLHGGHVPCRAFRVRGPGHRDVAERVPLATALDHGSQENRQADPLAGPAEQALRGVAPAPRQVPPPPPPAPPTAVAPIVPDEGAGSGPDASREGALPTMRAGHPTDGRVAGPPTVTDRAARETVILHPGDTEPVSSPWVPFPNGDLTVTEQSIFERSVTEESFASPVEDLHRPVVAYHPVGSRAPALPIPMSGGLASPFSPFSRQGTVEGDGNQTVVDPGYQRPTVALRVDPQRVPSETVDGLACTNGHFTDPARQHCLFCNAEVDWGKGLVSGQRPVLGTIAFGDGREVALDRSIVIGRKLPNVAVADPSFHSFDGDSRVSRRHIEMRPEGWDAVVIDLDSGNGTKVATAGRETVCTANVPIVLADGAAVHIGAQRLVFTRTRT